MEPRIDYRKYAAEAQKSLYALEKYIAECGLDHKLIHLIKMRASQINGCAYCIDMHSKDARAMGVEETPGDQVPLLAGAAITPPSRTVNDLVGVSEPVAGSTARPRVSRAR